MSIAELNSRDCELPSEQPSRDNIGTLLQLAESRAEMLAFERVISEVALTLVNLLPDQVDSKIENGLQDIADALGTDRVTLGRLDPNVDGLTVTHSWARSGIPTVPHKLAKEMFPWLMSKIMKGEIVRVDSIDDLPADARMEREYMLSINMKSVLIVPLFSGGKVIGVSSTGCFHQKKEWDPEVISRFQLVGTVFSNALARKLADQDLQRAFCQVKELKERLELEVVILRDEVEQGLGQTKVIGQSSAIQNVLKKAKQVAETDSVVLILGETGTGKELIAATVHQWSRRKDRPMVKINCAALPATLIESELFGREKGAYTGALSREIGRFELADKSTILLDEIGELPLELQGKLLRVLQEGEFERLGSSRTLQVDTRVIASTNRNLHAMVKEGKFREDLFYRLNVFPIEVPPLRERREDIPALTWHILGDLGRRMGRNVESVRASTLKDFQDYQWPGNVRELRNIIERYLILRPGPIFQAEAPDHKDPAPLAGDSLEQVECVHIRHVLEGTQWRVRGKDGAASILGLKPTTLEARMRKLHIARPH